MAKTALMVRLELTESPALLELTEHRVHQEARGILETRQAFP
jgi:hypothetical protein